MNFGPFPVVLFSCEIHRRFRELGHIYGCDVLAAERLTSVIQDKSGSSLTLKEKLKIARRAVNVKRESPKMGRSCKSWS